MVFVHAGIIGSVNELTALQKASKCEMAKQLAERTISEFVLFGMQFDSIFCQISNVELHVPGCYQATTIWSFLIWGSGQFFGLDISAQAR